MLLWLFYKFRYDRELHIHCVLLIPLAISIFSIATTVYATSLESPPSGLLLLNLSLISIIIYDWIETNNYRISYII